MSTLTAVKTSAAARDLLTLAHNISFIDLRAPAEFARGALPGAVNLPLLTDSERAEVGIAYKNRGQQAAVDVGHRLVGETQRKLRTAQWREHANTHPDCWLYCWRGGMRSEIAQSWLAQSGLDIPRVAGGFKALRQACLDVLANAPKTKRWLVLAGRTGSGKTKLLREFETGIDLEGLAHHRGSAFGARSEPQPMPVDFENRLAVAFVNHSHGVVLLEDESRNIGRLALPETWHEKMQQAPLVVVDVTIEERVENIQREYVLEPLSDGVSVEELETRYRDALNRIERRLGGLRHREVREKLQQGFATGKHEGWIERLLSWYYDPMYDYQLEKKLTRVIARGDTSAIRKLIADY
ncbi:MAG: tRNA 2-selenouridine(34) synthase MnmH [Gammaproteobacteria bacterium]|nr:tRNA 2-selenouridine(34) synthase MnmH [Gammaproteobacteria bacterium]